MGLLVLSRKLGESIRIGDDIEIIVTEITPNRVKIGIKSPKYIPIYREELYEKIKEENKKAALIQHEDLMETPVIMRKYGLRRGNEKGRKGR